MTGVGCPLHPPVHECPSAALRAEVEHVLAGLGPTLAAAAAEGARPGCALVVLTDVRNSGWFYPPGASALSAADLAREPDHPVTLVRSLREVLPRLLAACPRCAGVLLSTPREYLPVYFRLGPQAEAFTGRVAFPVELVALARRTPRRLH